MSIVISLNLPLHNSLHFDSGVKFLLYPLIDGLQKGPRFPQVPRGFLIPMGLSPSIPFHISPELAS